MDSELLECLKDKPAVLCAVLVCKWSTDLGKATATYEIGSYDDSKTILGSLPDCDSIVGTIWLSDGSWVSQEYVWDCEEEEYLSKWVWHKMPTIPEHLKGSSYPQNTFKPRQQNVKS